MCEGPSLISGPIPPDPILFPEYYKRPSSARGRLEGNANGGTLTLLTGPLAPDPVLHPGYYSARAPRPPRIGPNATHILERGQRGVVGAILKLEGVSLSPHPTKQKPTVRDYGKENVRRLREIQRRCREQEAKREHARPMPVKALWTSPKYQDVPSRVMAQLQETGPPKRPECQNFLKAHSLCGSGGLPQTRHTTPATSSLMGSRPASCTPTAESADTEMQVRGRMVDFVSHNARAAGKTTMRRSQSLQNLQDKQPASAIKGRVPQYLEERKKQWQKEEEERRKKIPDPSMPPGHTQMSEKDRKETLQSLRDTHRSLVNELLSLPVRADTLSVQTRRAKLDRQLSEVEEAMKIFSRDKVYVKIDS